MSFIRREYGRGHAYFDEHGRKVPSVTTILSKGIPKPALVDWAARESAQYVIDRWDELVTMKPSERFKAVQAARFEAMDRAKIRGTRIHELGQRIVLGESVDAGELQGPAEAYARLCDAFDLIPVRVERPIINRQFGYAGTFDLLCRINTVAWLVDLKTGRSGVFGETALQLAAYNNADACLLEDGTELPWNRAERCGVIHIGTDSAQLIPVDAGREQFRAFLYAKQLADWLEHSATLIGAPIDTPPRLEVAQ